MSDSPAMSFEDRLALLIAQTGGQVPVAAIGQVVGELGRSLAGDFADRDLGPELAALLALIRQTRDEIAALGPDELRAEQIPKANDQLQAVVAATEEATGIFLDAAEELENIAEASGGALAERLRGITTRIYEASNFQDITGQRITKVVATLVQIESRLSRLSGVAEAVPAKSVPVAAPPGENSLLNGPQLPDAASTQDDIDRLFAAL